MIKCYEITGALILQDGKYTGWFHFQDGKIGQAKGPRMTNTGDLFLGEAGMILENAFLCKPVQRKVG